MNRPPRQPRTSAKGVRRASPQQKRKNSSRVQHLLRTASTKRPRLPHFSYRKIKRTARAFFREYKRDLPHNPLLFAPLLPLCALTLLFLFDLLFRAVTPSGAHLYAAVAAIEIIALFLPCMLYIDRRAPIKDRMGLSLPTPDKLPLLVLSALTLFFGAAALTSLGAYFGLTEVRYSLFALYDIPASTPMAGLLFSLVTFALIPAVIEEILCRGVLFAEYSAYGPVTALIMTSLFSALFSLSPSDIPSALFCGLLLGAVRLLTGSLLSCVLLRIVYHTLCLFYEHFFGIMGDQLSEFFILFFLCAVAALLLAFFLLGEGERVMRRHALERSDSPLSQESERRHEEEIGTRDALRISFISPTLWITVILYVLFSLIL